MAAEETTAELNQDAVLRFLAERGGRARNADLLEHFRAFLNSPEPQRRARARECFKELVNAVATVRQEPGSGAKYVQLRKKYRSPAAAAAGGPSAASSAGGGGDSLLAAAAAATTEPVVPAAGLPPEPESGDSGGGSSNRSSRDGDVVSQAGVSSEPLGGEEEERGSVSAASTTSPEEEESPVPSQQQQPQQSEAPQPNGQESPQQSQEPSGAAAAAGGGGGSLAKKKKRGSPLTVGQPGREAEQEDPCGGGSDGAGAEEEEDSLLCSPASPAAATAAVTAATTTTTTTPRCGRKNFRERMLGSSPQMKRSALLPRVGSGASRGGGGDSDTASLASSSAEEESGSGAGSVALDPLEHEWMLCASDGCWETLEALLSCEPALLSKRDFVTGFTCLHWAAKHGRHELLALLVNFAHRHSLPVNVNARTSGGYTALHLAAMHGHLEVVKLLVGAYDADVDVRDYSGRKASHYLSRGATEEVRSLVGALQDEAGGGAPNGSGRWRLSRVLPSHLIAYKLPHLHHGDEGESGEGAGLTGKGKELNRKISGGGRIKPRLNKIRFRTQIIHTTPSFRGDAEEEGQEEKSLKASFKLRPKSNVFG